jgi:Protein of unknown function (DUF5818)
MTRTCISSFASFVLMSALPLAGLALAQERRAAYPPEQTTAQQSQDNPADVRTFAGKISKSGGKYVLEDASSKTAFSLDDQKTAKKYEGKSVVVTGSLDTANNLIHVQKIEAAA